MTMKEAYIETLKQLGWFLLFLAAIVAIFGGIFMALDYGFKHCPKITFTCMIVASAFALITLYAFEMKHQDEYEKREKEMKELKIVEKETRERN